MKVLSIIEATTVTGPAKNLLNFCRLMRSSEFAVDGKPFVEVSIVTFDRGASVPGAVATGSSVHPDTWPNAFVTAAREMGITVDVISERFRFDPSVISQLRTIVARRAPDVIQTHMIKSHFLVKLTGLGTTHPWIAYHHGYTSTDAKMLAYNQLNRWSLRSADRVITVCAAFSKQLTRAGVRAERISVCHNSVKAPRRISPAEQRALREQFQISDDERVIVSVGRLSREKGHEDLVQAIASVREMDPTLKFKVLLVGDGPEHAQLESTAGDLRLNEEIVFVGHVSDVAPFYSIADVLALPSHSEGSPNVLLEAMAAGIPVVATAVGGVPEIAVSGENALLVPARQPHEFAEALLQILSERDLAEKLAANATIRAREFSPEAYAHRMIHIYKQVSETRIEPKASADSSASVPLATPRPSWTSDRKRDACAPVTIDPVAIASGTDTSA
jgi:glycosyltransferase involved in cell wall biosynthesis